MEDLQAQGTHREHLQAQKRMEDNDNERIKKRTFKNKINESEHTNLRPGTTTREWSREN